MATQHLETLQLDQHQVEIAADFFEAYASFIQSDSSGTGGEDALVDAASSLRIAGQWAMFLDPQRAIDLFTASALLWQRAGYGYGTFLLAAFAPSQLNRAEMVDRLDQLVQPYNRRRRSAGERQLSGSLLYPQQQAYLLLAETGMSQQMDLPAEDLRLFTEQSPHRRGVAPIGSLGTPLRVYWDIARRFLERDAEQTAAGIAQDLALIAASYAETINSAMTNQRLWFNAAAPVDVGDTDTAAIAMIAARRLGSDLTRRHLQSVANDLEPIARVPLELAIEMVERSQGGPADTPTYAL
jgi:hypothetical protein